jgi:hypothetical protein
MLVIGAVLFAVSIVRATPDDEPRVITVPAAVTLGLRAEFAASHGIEPDAAELDRLVETWVAEQVLAEEGIARGLPEHDPLIRRRLVERMRDELASDVAVASPTDADLQKWLDDHADRYALLPRVSFEHVYFPTAAAEGSGATPDPMATLGALRAGGDAAGIGAAFPYGSVFSRRAQEQVAWTFGDDFAALLAARAADGSREWFGPVPSPFGQHLVRITDFDAGSVAPLERVRDRVTADWTAEQQGVALRRAVEALRATWEVRLEQP